MPPFDINSLVADGYTRYLRKAGKLDESKEERLAALRVRAEEIVASIPLLVEDYLFRFVLWSRRRYDSISITIAVLDTYVDTPEEIDGATLAGQVRDIVTEAGFGHLLWTSLDCSGNMQVKHELMLNITPFLPKELFAEAEEE